MRKRRPRAIATIPADALNEVNGGCKKKKGRAEAAVQLQISGAGIAGLQGPGGPPQGGAPAGGPPMMGQPQAYRTPGVAIAPGQAGGGNDSMMDFLLLSMMMNAGK